MPSNIVVEPKINNGSPSVKAANGGYSTVKQVVALINAGLEVKEVSTELLITPAVVYECVEYVKLYPQVMGC